MAEGEDLQKEDNSNFLKIKNSSNKIFKHSSVFCGFLASVGEQLTECLCSI